MYAGLRTLYFSVRLLYLEHLEMLQQNFQFSVRFPFPFKMRNAGHSLSPSLQKTVGVEGVIYVSRETSCLRQSLSSGEQSD